MTTPTINFDPTTLLTVALRNAVAGDRGVSADELPEELDQLKALAKEDELREDLRPVERRKVKKILTALDRVNDGTYGTSVVSGQPISPGRLRAMPWADCTSLEAHRRSDVEGTLVLESAAS